MFVLGDSHTLMVTAAARSRGLPLRGGFLAGGRQVNVRFHEHRGGDFVFLNPEIDERYRAHLAEASVARFADLEGPVLCMVGMNLHYLARREVWDGFAIAGDPGAGADDRAVSRAAVRATFRDMIPGALEFYAQLVAMGFRVFSALPPRRIPANSVASVFHLLEEIAIAEISAIGVTIVDHRGWSLDDRGNCRPEFAPEDPNDEFHANAAFGARLLDQWLEMAGPAVRERA